MFFVWLSLFFILVVIELMTVNLVSIWFAAGALAASIVTFWTDIFTIQILVFCIISILALLVTKPLVKKFQKGTVIATNLDRVIGKIAIVTEDIIPLSVGEVKVDGKKWSAVSEEKIKKDSKVEILSIDGVKLHVKKIKEEK